jgi:hypothetical protein
LIAGGGIVAVAITFFAYGSSAIVTDLESGRLSFAIQTLDPGETFRSNETIREPNPFYVAVHNDVADVPVVVTVTDPNGNQVGSLITDKTDNSLDIRPTTLGRYDTSFKNDGSQVTQITINVGYYPVLTLQENDFWSTTVGIFTIAVYVGLAGVAVLVTGLGLHFREKGRKPSYFQ